MANELTDRFARLGKTLSKVESVAQARKAADAAIAEAERGEGMISDLPGGVVGFFGSLIGESNVGVTEAQASREIGGAKEEIKRLRAELPSPASDRKKVDSYTWSRLSQAITTAYLAVAGVEGAINQLGTFDPVANLGKAIGEAPGVFVEGTKEALVRGGDVAGGVAKAAGIGAGKALKGAGEGIAVAGAGAGEGINSILKGVLGKLWWVVVLVVIAGVVYFVVLRRSLKIPKIG